jgi:hypothetical protein
MATRFHVTAVFSSQAIRVRTISEAMIYNQNLVRSTDIRFVQRFSVDSGMQCRFCNPPMRLEIQMIVEGFADSKEIVNLLCCWSLIDDIGFTLLP